MTQLELPQIVLTDVERAVQLLGFPTRETDRRDLLTALVSAAFTSGALAATELIAESKQ